MIDAKGGRPPSGPTRPIPGRPAEPKPAQGPGWSAWLADPRTAVLAFLGSALIFGGGRRVLQGLRARRAIAAIEGDDPTPAEIAEAAEHGRAGLVELFRLLGTSTRAEVRDAAGRALSRLWRLDEMIPEEEKALVRRGFAVDWRARRRYPRALRASIPIGVSYGVPFLVDGPRAVGPGHLEWSHRILGAGRAGLEQFSPWQGGVGSARFAIEPGDFATDGPHRLALHARVRTVGLTTPWEVELPQIPFSFEFDPRLAVDALLTLPDDARGAWIARAVRLEPGEHPDDAPGYLDLGADLLLRNPPRIAVEGPLPCDLAHALALEIEGVEGRHAAGSVVVEADAAGVRHFAIGPDLGLPPGALDRPGEVRIRAHLAADPDLGWADPAIRSIWPGPIVTDWFAARVVRR